MCAVVWGRRRVTRIDRTLHVDTGGVLWIATESSVSRFSGTAGYLALPLVEGAWSPNIAQHGRPTRPAPLWICEQGNGLFRWTNGHLSAFQSVA